MLGLFETMAYAEDAQAGGITTTVVSLAPVAIFVLIFYFLLIRPQQKKAKQHREMLEKLDKGDMVVTMGGLYGKVLNVKDDTVQLEIADNVRVKVERGAIQIRKPQE